MTYGPDMDIVKHSMFLVRDQSDFMTWGVEVFEGGTKFHTENLGGGVNKIRDKNLGEGKVQHL